MPAFRSAAIPDSEMRIDDATQRRFLNTDRGGLLCNLPRKIAPFSTGGVWKAIDLAAMCDPKLVCMQADLQGFRTSRERCCKSCISFMCAYTCYHRPQGCTACWRSCRAAAAAHVGTAGFFEQLHLKPDAHSTLKVLQSKADVSLGRARLAEVAYSKVELPRSETCLRFDA